MTGHSLSIFCSLVRSLILVPVATGLLGVGCTLAQYETGDQYENVLNLVRDSKFKTAEKVIDGLLAANIDDHKAHLLRNALANALVRANKRDRAEIEFQKFLDYLVSGTKASRPMLRHLPQILVNTRYLRENEEPKASLMLGKIITVLKEAVQDEPGNVGFSAGLSMAVNYRARGLGKQGKYLAAQEVYSTELNRLRDNWRNSLAVPASWLRLAYFLETAIEPSHERNQEFASKLRLERKNLLRAAVEKFPDSADVVEAYVNDEILLIEQLEPRSPKAAFRLAEELRARVDHIRSLNASPRRLLNSTISVAKVYQRLQRRLNRESLVGSTMQQLEGIDWMGDSKPLAFPSDAEVALVFVAPDKPQSREALKKLSELSEQRPGKFDLLVVSSDQGHSFVRLQSIKRQSQESLAKSNRNTYRESQQKRIIEIEGGSAAIGFATDAGAIASQFGIDSLPFLVVLDRNGVCQGVFSGNLEIDKIAAALEH